MQFSTLVILSCLAAAAYSYPSPALDTLDVPEDQAIHEALFEVPQHERSHRDKRGLLLLKKKLLLGALGLKAAKIGAVGAGVGAVGALALKSKPKVTYKSQAVHSYGYSSHGPEWKVEVHSWH